MQRFPKWYRDPPYAYKYHKEHEEKYGKYSFFKTVQPGELTPGNKRDRPSMWLIKGKDLFIVCPTCKSINALEHHGVQPSVLIEDGKVTAVGLLKPSFSCKDCLEHSFLILEGWDISAERGEKLTEQELKWEEEGKKWEKKWEEWERRERKRGRRQIWWQGSQGWRGMPERRWGWPW